MLEFVHCSALAIFILLDEMEILGLGNICYLRKIICEFNKIKYSRGISNNDFAGISLPGVICGLIWTSTVPGKKVIGSQQ